MSPTNIFIFVSQRGTYPKITDKNNEIILIKVSLSSTKTHWLVFFFFQYVNPITIEIQVVLACSQVVNLLLIKLLLLSWSIFHTIFLCFFLWSLSVPSNWFQLAGCLSLLEISSSLLDNSTSILEVSLSFSSTGVRFVALGVGEGWLWFLCRWAKSLGPPLSKNKIESKLNLY